jgi:Family of unknown function (DUF6011)
MVIVMENQTVAMTDPAVVRRFVLAGDAIITLQSERTGGHFTFRVRKAKEGETWFVSVLAGPEHYNYMGILREIGGRLDFRHTHKAKVPADSSSFQGFAFFWRHIAAEQMPPQMAIRHEGRCGRCGRPLTHPSSIDLGIGPECANKMGL